MDVWIYAFFITVLSVSTTEGCYNLDQCFQSEGFTDLVSKYEKGKLIINGQEVQTLCNDWQPTQDCIERNLGSCYNDAKKAAYKTIFNMFDYLCNEGKEDYLKHVECYTKPIITTGLASCSDTFKQKGETLKTAARWGTKSKSELKSGFCRLKDEYLDCIGVKIERNCGKEAETTFRIFMEKSVQPIVELFECNKSNNKTIIIGCIVGGIALLVIIIIAIVWHKRKNAGRRQAAQDTKYGQV